MKEITQEQKEQLINLNDSKVNEILGVKKLEVGKWYKYEDNYVKWLMCYQGEYSSCYGWNTSVNYGDHYYMSKENLSWMEATHEEVENALIAEAKKRGFKKGVILNRTWINANNSIIKVIEGNFKLKDNRLLADGREAFVDGKWAEVIEQKPNKQEIINQINELLNQL